MGLFRQALSSENDLNMFLRQLRIVHEIVPVLNTFSVNIFLSLEI